MRVPVLFSRVLIETRYPESDIGRHNATNECEARVDGQSSKALFQKLVDIRDASEGDFTTGGGRPALRWRHTNKDAVAPEAVINLVHSAGQFFRFTARRRFDVCCARE